MMSQDEYRAKFNEDDSVGWDAIDEKLEAVYGKQEPRHYGTLIKWFMGGDDPLDGVSIYDCHQQAFHRHLVSYGMSELYFNPESAENEFSKWGFEFTARILPFSADKSSDNAEHEPTFLINVMQNLARYVFESGKWFEPYHFIPCNSPIRMETDTLITGVAFVPDPVLNKIDTPNGEVQFLQMVGLTDNELAWLWENPKTWRVEELINKMREDNPLLIMDLERKKQYV